MHCKIFAQCFSTSIYNVLRNPHVCIVGSGPAGFYTTQKILKLLPSATVDIYEKLPVPFGLVRYGVAPDHPEVKNCIATFNKAAKNERVSFLGNVSIGSDITLSELREAYDAIVLAYGAAKDKLLNIPNENLKNIWSAREFVGWYNGLPEDSNLPINLDAEDVAIIGHGNVAIDLARILLTSLDTLKKTDMPEPVLEALCKSRVKRVHMIGRRSSQHVAFTIKELRELLNLEDCRMVLKKEDFSHLPHIIPDVQRPKKRLLELLAQTSLEPTQDQINRWENATKECHLHFLLTPTEFVQSHKEEAVQGIKFLRNRIDNNKALPTEKTFYMDCQLVLRSVGYTSIKIDPLIPFDQSKGLIPNNGGKVIGHDDLYVSGWLGTGPVGVIAATMASAFKTGKLVASDLKSSETTRSTKKSGKPHILELLSKREVKHVTFNEWNQLDLYEVQEGTKKGKPREKITDLNEMLQIVGKEE